MKVSNNMFLKFSVIILVTILIVNSMPLMAIAKDTTLNQTDIPDNAVHIKTAKDLAAIGGADSEVQYVVLDSDIELDDEWKPIEGFRGTFDGQGYKINNLYVLESSIAE